MRTRLLALAALLPIALVVVPPAQAQRLAFDGCRGRLRSYSCSYDRELAARARADAARARAEARQAAREARLEPRGFMLRDRAAERGRLRVEERMERSHDRADMRLRDRRGRTRIRW